MLISLYKNKIIFSLNLLDNHQLTLLICTNQPQDIQYSSMEAIKLSKARAGDRVTSTNLHPVERDFVYEFKIMGFDACFGKRRRSE